MDTRRFIRRADRYRHDGHIRLTAPRLPWPVASWVFVLLAIGVVQIVRVQWFDAAVFFAAGLAVLADGLRSHNGRAAASDTHARGDMAARWHTRVPTGPTPLLWMSLAAGVGGAVMCVAPRHGTVMKIAVIAVGVATVGLAWRGAAVAHPRAATRLSRGIVHLALAWALIVIAGCIWELAQFILGLVDPRATWFALSDLLNPAVATVPGRILFVVGWLALGLWLLRRGGRR